MAGRAPSSIGDENSLSHPGPHNLGAITNWTGSNVTDDTSRSLLSQVPENQGLPRLPEVHSWHQTYSGTLSTILLLHLLFFYQMNRQKTKKQCMVSYSQLVRRRQYFKGVLAILSHPPSEENDGIRWSPSIDFGAVYMAEGDHWVQRITARLLPLLHGRWNGLPLLLYISHLLWSCRSLEPTFHSSWHFARSILALAILAMVLELHGKYYLLERTSDLLGSESHSSVDMGSIQPDSSLGPIVRARSLILHHTMGTCSSLLYAILFLYGMAFPKVALPVLPFLSIPWYPWVSYLLCSTILGLLSWRHHLATSFMAGTAAGFLWVSGFHFLGEVYWSIWWVGMVGIASILSLKAEHWPTLPGVEVSWDTQGIIRVDGLPVITSLFRHDPSWQEPPARRHEGSHQDEEDIHGDYGEESDDDDDRSVSDLENPLIRGRTPLLNLDPEDEQASPAKNDNGLTRRGGRLS
jgi:hypothetical protein